MQAQIYLGSDTFVKKMQDEVDKKPAFTEIPPRNVALWRERYLTMPRRTSAMK